MSELLKEEKPVREPFTVDNDMKAEWCLSKIRKIRADQKEQKDELTRQMQFYKDQMDMIDKEAEDDVAFFEGILRGYFADRVDAGFTKATKTQTAYKLPSGKLILKRQEPTFERKDDELIPWLKKNSPEMVKVKEEPNWAELKKTVNIVGDSIATKDGEVIPGVKVTEREDKFVVEV